MKQRRDYLVNMESASGVDLKKVYHGTLKEAKRAVRWWCKKMKDGDRLIIRVGNENSKDYGKIVAEYFEKEGWIDFIAEIVDKKSLKIVQEK